MTVPDDYAPFDPDATYGGPHGEREPAPVATIEFKPASIWAGTPKPERRFLVPTAGMLPIANVSSLYGDGGTGKSLLALQLAIAASTGSSWMGHLPQAGPCLYFSAEDDEEETQIRLRDICEGTGVDLASVDQLHIAYMAGKDAILAQEDAKRGRMQATPLLAALSSSVAHYRPRLVVLDNLADIFAGNENARPLARQFVGFLRAIAREHDCAILFLAHPSLSGIGSGRGTSGNTAWSNSVRSRLYLQRQHEDASEITDPDYRVLRSMKSNYAAAGGEIGMRWQRGLFVPTDTAATATAAVSGLDRMAAQSKAERVFLSLLRQFEDQGRTVSPNKSASYAPTVFATHPGAEGVTKRQLERAMEALLSAATITIGTIGPPSRRVSKLAIVEAAGDEG